METENNKIECQALVETVNKSGNTAIELEELGKQDQASFLRNKSETNDNDGQTPVETVSMKSGTSLEMEPVGEQDNTTSPGNSWSQNVVTLNKSELFIILLVNTKLIAVLYWCNILFNSTAPVCVIGHSMTICPAGTVGDSFTCEHGCGQRVNLNEHWTCQECNKWYNFCFKCCPKVSGN